MSDTKTNNTIKVHYVAYPFWRGETLKLGLFLQGIPFENATGSMDELKSKGLSPFGSFPVLELPDGRVLSQTQACAAYVGKLGTMYPSNDDIYAQGNCDQIINGCTDITETIVPTMRGMSKDEAKEARENLIDPENGRFYKQLSGLNSVVCRDGSVYACGKEHGLTVADLAVWKLMQWFLSGSIDHIPMEFFESFTNLKSIHENVNSNEKVQEYQKQYHPKK